MKSAIRLDQAKSIALAGLPRRRRKRNLTVSGCLSVRARRYGRISSVQTLKLTRVLGPKVLLIGTSAASRPRAIRMRPIRGALLRGSKAVPGAAKIGFEPAGKVHRRVRRRQADVAEIAGAIARRNVHAATQRDREMREVAADAATLVEGLAALFSSRGHARNQT